MAFVQSGLEKYDAARQEMFVPPAHPAGEAQVDFGEALVVIASVEHKAHCLVTVHSLS